jgi:hypothetical protein
MTEEVKYFDKLLALIIRAGYKAEGLHFFTPNDFSQQLAYMNHPAGKKIAPHSHNPVPREVNYTQEVLFIRSGRVKVDFYDDDRKHLEARILESGDVILLVSGGHGFTMLEQSEIIEVKQGPYVGHEDKTKFEEAGE